VASAEALKTQTAQDGKGLTMELWNGDPTKGRVASEEGALWIDAPRKLGREGRAALRICAPVRAIRLDGASAPINRLDAVAGWGRRR
jgi:hypothetical protein